jgi:DNA excision repair protein ERCC-5
LTGEVIDTTKEEYTYYEELENSAALEALKKKRKLDQYELPELNQAQLSNKLDPRLATEEE